MQATTSIIGTILERSIRRTSVIACNATSEADTPARNAPAFFSLLRQPAVALATGLGICEALDRVGLAKSKSEARRTAEQGGAYVNNRSVPADYTLSEQDLASESVIVLRSGKRRFALLRLGES